MTVAMLDLPDRGVPFRMTIWPERIDGSMYSLPASQSTTRAAPSRASRFGDEVGEIPRLRSQARCARDDGGMWQSRCARDDAGMWRARCAFNATFLVIADSWRTAPTLLGMMGDVASSLCSG